MKLILACDPKGGIGYQNKLPWDKIQGDLPRFKQLTTEQKIVMGRKTWDSLPIKPLPNRVNYVLSKNPVTNAMSFSNEKLFRNIVGDDVWIIGGATVVERLWQYINEIHLTRTFTEYTCDTFIDLLKLENEFVCESKEQYTDHTYEIWKRK